LRSKVSSDWLPNYINATRPVLVIFKMDGYFPDSPRIWFYCKEVLNVRHSTFKLNFLTKTKYATVRPGCESVTLKKSCKCLLQGTVQIYLAANKDLTKKVKIIKNIFN